MAPIPIIAPTIVRFSMDQIQLNGRHCQNTVDVSLDEFAGSRSSAVSALAPLVVGEFQDRIVAHQWNDLTFIGARFLDLDSIDGHGGFQGPVGGKPTAGTATAVMTSQAVSLLAHLTCVHNRRERNGRMYLGGIGENDFDESGIVAGAVISGWNTALTSFKSNLGSGTFFPPASTAWRIVHVAGHTGTSEPGFPNGRPNAWSSSDVDSIFVDSRVATQRRRNRG